MDPTDFPHLCGFVLRDGRKLEIRQHRNEWAWIVYDRATDTVRERFGDFGAWFDVNCGDYVSR
jgi:hypothetical protein